LKRESVHSQAFKSAWTGTSETAFGELGAGIGKP
jgi:hypothetical protein